MKKWMNFFETLAGKLTAILAFAILLVALLALIGNSIPEKYLPLVYIVAIGAMIIFTIQIFVRGRKTNDSDNNASSISAGKNIDKSNVILGSHNQVNLIVQEYARLHGDISKEDLQRQLEEYLDWVQESFGTIVLRGIVRGGDPVVNLPLETMYVPLQAELQISQDERGFDNLKNASVVTLAGQERMGSKKIKLNEVLSFGNRLIITGGPGSGKTTVLLHLAWTLAASLRGAPHLAKQKLGLAGNLPLPIYIPLTRYADYLRKLPVSATAEQTSLKTYVSEYLNERGTNLEMLPHDFLNFLLRDGNTVLLLLDGLDEVPNEDERILIRSRIEDLVSGKKNLRVVATSRSTAYQGQAVLGRDFQHIHVLPLDNQQIAKLVHQAYNSIYPKSETRARQQADDLLSNIEQLESGRRSRLGDNIKPLVDAPIMIRMLLIVHYNDRKLPDQRADLYQRAVDVVLLPDNAPDRSVTEEIGKRIAGSLAMNREMLQHLAFHMHKQGDEQGRDIDEAGLRKILNAEQTYKPYVDELIAQTRQRGTLLEESGGLYRFLHLSFQEFLVGRYLAQNFSDIDQLVAFLQDGLCTDSWWREPILLMIGYQDINAPIQARRVLLRLAGLDENAVKRVRQPLDLELAACELAAIAYLECKSQASDLGELLRSRLQVLHQESRAKKWSPVIMASAMDSLDRLGHLPDDLHAFLPIPGQKYSFSKYLITNLQYERFLKPENFTNKNYWMDFPKYDENSQPMPKQTWGSQAWDWVQKNLNDEDNLVENGVLYPRYWRDPRFGSARRTAPVVGISWYEASAYCKWLLANWEQLDEGKQGLPKPGEIRLPLEAEWQTAAGGIEPKERFAWGVLKDEKEITRFANTDESDINKTTPVWMYPQGRSPHDIMDMSGNVWEWQANFYDKDHDYLGLRGGWWFDFLDGARVAYRFGNPPFVGYDGIGFREVFFPSE